MPQSYGCNTLSCIGAMPGNSKVRIPKVVSKFKKGKELKKFK
jgi:hypothetical protein